MTKEELAKAYANEFNKEYQQIAYDAFLCGYGAKCDTIAPDGLEEAAEEYRRESCNAALKPNVDGPTPEYVGSIKAAFIAGAKWQKDKMMEEAIHYVVQDDLSSYGASYNVPFIRIGSIALKPRGIEVGDKVKIIIVKEGKK